MKVEPYRSDPAVTKSPTKVDSYSQLRSLIRADPLTQTDGITKASEMRVREPPESKELRPLETSPRDRQSSDAGGISGFTPPQPIINRGLVGVSTPRERLEVGAGTEVTVQSTPGTLPRGRQRAGQTKPKVTFATSPFEKEAARSVQKETTPRNGVQRRTIFEDDVFGAGNAWERPAAKSSEKHSTLVGVGLEFDSV